MPGTTTLPLSTSGRVTLNAAGHGQIVLGPGMPGEFWEISLVVVTTTQASSDSVNVPTVTLYRNYVGPGQQIGGTFSGVMDTGSGSITLAGGEKIVAVWDGADANQTGTITITGNDNFPGKRWVGA